MEATKGSESQESKPLVDDELLKSLDDNPDKFGELSPEQQQEVHSLLMEQAENPEETPDPKPESTEEPPKEEPEENLAETPEAEPKEEKPEQKEKAEPEPEEQIKEEVQKKRSEAQKYADELNRIRQKIDSRKKALSKDKEKLKSLGEKTYEVEDDDVYDQGKLKGMLTENQRLKERLDLLEGKLLNHDQTALERAQQREQELQERRIFAEVDDLQKDFPDLKTSTAFEKMNSDYAKHLDNIVELSGIKTEDLEIADEQKADPNFVRQTLRNKAYELYETDESLKEKADKRKPKSFQNEEDEKNYFRILDMNDRKSKVGGTLKMNFYDYLDENGLLEKYLQREKRETAVKASNLAADAIENNSPTPLSPSDGPSESPSNSADWTIQRAEQKMDMLQKKLESGGLWNAEETAEAKAVMTFLEGAKKG